MKKENNVGIKLVGLLLSIGVPFFGAFVLMKVYNWFIPSITGWDVITYWMAMGIDIVISTIHCGLSFNVQRIKGATLKSDDVDDVAEPIVEVIVYAVLLGIGALVQLGV